MIQCLCCYYDFSVNALSFVLLHIHFIKLPAIMYAIVGGIPEGFLH